jgi:acyl dehydratase
VGVQGAGSPAGLDLSRVGVACPPETFSWDSRDAILYALGVGAGADDPCAELEYTTENSAGHPQQVLPTFAALFGASVPPLGTFDRRGLLHVGQGLELERPLPVAGTLSRTVTVTGIYDLGSAALVQTKTDIRAVDGSGRYAFATSEFYLRGGGGFGGTRPPPSAWSPPSRDPEEVVTCETLVTQSLIYRLSGDRNPIHSDPGVARQAGYPRPILHGLSTFGVAARALMRVFVEPEKERLWKLRGRFSRPVMPGETLRVEVWRDGPHAAFRVIDPHGMVVFDRGEAEKTTSQGTPGRC